MITKNKNFFVVYCIGSGFAALAVVLNSLLHILSTIISIALEDEFTKVSFILMYIYAFSLSIFGIFCGLKIANNSPKGNKYLKYYLIPQIPLISIPGFIYYFKLGFDFTIYCILDKGISAILGTRINFSIGSFFNLNFETNVSQQAVFVGVNIVPILLLASLIKVRRKGKAKKKVAAK
jgi:hypothetical protein